MRTQQTFERNRIVVKANASPLAVTAIHAQPGYALSRTALVLKKPIKRRHISLVRRAGAWRLNQFREDLVFAALGLCGLATILLALLGPLT